MKYFIALAVYRGTVYRAEGITRYLAKKQIKEILWNQGARPCDEIKIVTHKLLQN